MIDVHVLTHSGTRKDWLDRCISSLANEPVVVHLVEGVEGNVGAGRAKGFALGGQEFVSYVDSDDYILPGWYSKSLELLQMHHAVVPKEFVEYADGRRHRFPKSGHNGVVYRRADIEPLIDRMGSAPYAVDVMVRRELKPVKIDHVGYVWTVHSEGAHAKLTEKRLMQETQQWLTSAQ